MRTAFGATKHRKKELSPFDIALYVLAERLGKTLTELENMDMAEFEGWMAYSAHINKSRQPPPLPRLDELSPEQLERLF